MLIVPKYINADGLVSFLEQLAKHAGDPELTVNFSGLQRVSPAGLASLTAFMKVRANRRLETTVAGLESCIINSYLKRMNLHRLCGMEQEEAFTRQDPKARFVPLEEIQHQVEVLGEEIAACIAPGGEDYEHPNAGLYDAAWYLVTEMANNVRQHSRGVGFVAAQTTLSDGFVRIAIADCGCGIPTSLKDAGLEWAQELPDEDIIEKAMEARVTSKGQPANEGVGLTLSSRIVDLMGGHILVASRAGALIRTHNTAPKKIQFKNGNHFPGTMIALTFLRSEASDFHHKLHMAKELEIPLRTSPNPASFRP